MPEFTLTLSTKTVAGLQVLVQEVNENQGTSLTVQSYLELHAQELVINKLLQEQVSALQEEAREGANTALAVAIQEKRQGLLDDLADAPAAPLARVQRRPKRG